MDVQRAIQCINDQLDDLCDNITVAIVTEKRRIAYESVESNIAQHAHARAHHAFVALLRDNAYERVMHNGETNLVVNGSSLPSATWPRRADGVAYKKLQDMAEAHGLCVVRDDPSKPHVYVVLETLRS
jgi:hypothetical protein